MDVKLIIRAPNQNIEDQLINCNDDWTVSRLKTHLYEVYPNNPIVQEQKLIYCGRLLHDHLQLKDIIRHDDLQSSAHIFHLVWNSKSLPSSHQQSQNSSQTWVNPSGLFSNRERHVEAPESVLRQRTTNPISPQTNEFQTTVQQTPPNYLPMYPADPQILSQMVAMQQMYAQYLSQYFQTLNAVGATGNIPFIPIMPNLQPLQDSLPSNPNNSHEIAPQPANQRNNVPIVQVDENEFLNRDFLEYFFVYFRFLILLCIMYFYTTPERFMLVIIVVVVAFLYHEGWFVRQGIADAVRGQRNNQPDPNPNAANNANDQPSLNENDGQDAHELEAAMDGDDPPHMNPDAANNNNQVFSPLTFLATFFSSLIPETPPPVNIN